MRGKPTPDGQQNCRHGRLLFFATISIRELGAEPDVFKPTLLCAKTFKALQAARE
jgi:hypothetical protein